jgi:Lecithin retinol acyltransferase
MSYGSGTSSNWRTEIGKTWLAEITSSSNERCTHTTASTSATAPSSTSRGEPGGNKITACVCRSTMEDFGGDGDVQLRPYAKRLGADEAVARAKSRLGECGYNLLNNNCEHFARWCVTDRHSSAQINGVFATGGVGAAAASAATGGIGLVGAAGAAAGLSRPGIMSGLASVGGCVGGGAVAGIGVIGVVPGVASVGVMNVAPRDDDHLPDDIRAARRAGAERPQLAARPALSPGSAR